MSNNTFKHETESTVMNGVRRVALFIKSVDWTKYAKLLLKITWGIVLVGFSVVVLFFKAAALLGQNRESDDSFEDEGVDVYDGETFGKGTLYVDHSTGEESPMQLSGFKRV